MFTLKSQSGIWVPNITEQKKIDTIVGRAFAVDARSVSPLCYDLIELLQAPTVAGTDTGGINPFKTIITAIADEFGKKCTVETELKTSDLIQALNLKLTTKANRYLNRKKHLMDEEYYNIVSAFALVYTSIFGEPKRMEFDSGRSEPDSDNDSYNESSSDSDNSDPEQAMSIRWDKGAMTIHNMHRYIISYVGWRSEVIPTTDSMVLHVSAYVSAKKHMNLN